jgi:antitoxin component of RelBE/YafQ-DinJ toxin-antitoxin module
MASNTIVRARIDGQIKEGPQGSCFHHETTSVR